MTDALHLDYELKNTLDAPILVFDRLYDMEKQALDPQWYYAEIKGESAMLARKVWPVPRGMHHENPEVPYGRQIAVGETASGTIEIDLPLREKHPYYRAVHRSDPEVEVPLSQLLFQLGWASVDNLAWAGVANLNDEELYLFDYSSAISIQHVVTAEEVPARVPGMVSK